MDSYTMDNKINLSITNMSEFYKLLRKAADEAKQLESTIDEIRRFNIEFTFDFPHQTKGLIC